MKASEVRSRAFAMPLTSPAFPLGPYRFYRSRIPDHHLPHRPREAARARARAARGRRRRSSITSSSACRIRPASATTPRAGRSSRSRFQRPQGRLLALHVPRRPSADRRRPRALGLSQEARQADAASRRSTRWSARSITARCAIATGTMGYKHKQADLAAVQGVAGRRRTSCSRSSRMSTARRASASWSSIT